MWNREITRRMYTCITLNCIAFHFRFVIEYKSMTMNKTTHQLQFVCAMSVCDWNWVRYFAHTLKSPYGHFCYVVVYFLRFLFLFCLLENNHLFKHCQYLLGTFKHQVYIERLCAFQLVLLIVHCNYSIND